jgi:hypothetical protein
VPAQFIKIIINNFFNPWDEKLGADIEFLEDFKSKTI